MRKKKGKIEEGCALLASVVAGGLGGGGLVRKLPIYRDNLMICEMRYIENLTETEHLFLG